MKPSEFINQAWDLLQGVMEEAAGELAAIGLYPRAVFLLSRVEELPYPAQLAEALLVPAPTVSFIVRQFEKQGLLSRANDKKDLRRYRLSLTAKGKKSLAKARQVLDRCAEKRMAKLSKSELGAFAQMMRTLNAKPASPLGGGV